jgi:hypothetical protein
MNRRILATVLAMACAAMSEDSWREAQFEDQTVVQYAPGNSDYREMHRLRFTLSAQTGPEMIGPTLGWYQPGLLNATLATNLLDVSFYLFGGAVPDSTGITLKSAYMGNNTVARYTTNIPIAKGFEHGPHLAITRNTSSSSSGSPFSEYALGYTATWTKRGAWKTRTGKSNESSRTGATQNSLHLDLLLFPSTRSATDINTIGARLYLDGVTSLMGTERWGLYYVLGTGLPLVQDKNTTTAAESLDYNIPYPQVILGFGLYFGFI